MAIDPLKAVYVFLSTNSALQANNIAVYGPPGLPVDWSPSKTITFFGGGGIANRDLPIYSDSYRFYCYGSTSLEARFVHTVLYGVLHRTGVTDVVVGSNIVRITYISEISRPTDGVEQVTEYPYVLVLYQIKMVEVFV